MKCKRPGLTEMQNVLKQAVGVEKEAMYVLNKAVDEVK